MNRALIVLAVLALSGCDFGAATTEADVSVTSRVEDGGCPAQLRPGKATGEPCTVSGDCAEICCDCSNPNPYAAQACVNGACATPGLTCSKAQENKSSLCH